MQAVTRYDQTLDTLIEGWLFEKRNSKSGSAKTDRAYRETLHDFRKTLQRGGLDLDSEDQRTITDVAAIWAGMRAPGSKFEGDVSPATYNQRLAIVSSFYTYLQDQASQLGIELDNPIKRVKKRKVQAYAAAEPLDGDDTTAALARIDRSTRQGKRDYALLSVALSTGRRASELVSLRWKHVKQAGRKVILTFEHCKGGKTMRDQLDPDVSRVLMDYLHAVYGPRLASLASEAPIWISFSKQNAGQAISTHTLNDICFTILGTTRTHALRHTFAVEGEKVGMPISELSARLGHSDEKITTIYLKQARSAENPYASKLAARFKIGMNE